MRSAEWRVTATPRGSRMEAILHFAFLFLHSTGPPFYRGIAQYLERPAWDREAAGENPAAPTISRAAVAEIDEAFVF